MTTTTISPTRYDRMAKAAAFVALVIAFAALILALADRPFVTTAAAGDRAAGQPHATAQVASQAALVPGGSLYDDQVPGTGVGGGGAREDQTPRWHHRPGAWF